MKSLARIATAQVLAIGLVQIYGLISSGSAMAATRFTLQGSHIDAGYYGSAGLFSPRNVNTSIGKPVIVHCPGSSGNCVIEADLFIQSGKSDVAGNQYNPCLFVD